MKRLAEATLLAMACLFIGAIVFLYARAPGISEQVPSGASPMFVTIRTPTNREPVGLNLFTTIDAVVISAKPVASLELWIDGSLAQTRTPTGSNPTNWRVSFFWTPAGEGDHIVLVRAIDSDHRVGVSNILRLHAGPEANTMPEAEYSPQRGDTIESIAKDFETTPDEIVKLNTQLAADRRIDPSQQLVVPIQIPNFDVNLNPSPKEGEPPSGPAQTPSAPLNGFEYWINKNLSPFAPALPAPPMLQASRSGCNAQVSIFGPSKGEQGFFLYRLAPNTAIFKRIKTFGPANGTLPVTVEDANLYGQIEYYVSAFNGAGESPSNIISLDFSNAECLTPSWMNLHLKDAQLVISTPVDKPYCYLSDDGGPWVRIPGTPNTFLSPSEGKVDLAAYLGVLASPVPSRGLTLETECWGWEGGSLVSLGRAKQEIGANPQAGSGLQLIAPGYTLSGELDNAPDPAPSPPPPSLSIPWAGNLHATQDPHECATHLGVPLLGDLACAAAIEQSGNLVLVWSWPAVSCFPGQTCNFVDHVDGYHLYKIHSQAVSASQTALDSSHPFATVNGQGTTTTAVGYDWGFSSGPGGPDDVGCYYVTAFLDGNESAPSETICPPPPAAIQFLPTATSEAPEYQTVTIPGENLRDFNEVIEKKDIGSACPFSEKNYHVVVEDWAPADPFSVGYLHRDKTVLTCEKLINVWFEGATDLDLSALQGKQVINALLTYDMPSSASGDSESHDVYPETSCAAYLTYYPSFGAPKPDTLSVLSSSATQSARDVTKIVQNWVSNGSTHPALVLSGSSEDLANDNIFCISSYSNFQLTVTYK